MDCDAYRDQMLDVLYGEAAEPDRKTAEAHLAACAECRDELAAFRRLRRDLATWEAPAPARAPRFRRPLASLAVAAAAVLATTAAVALAGAEVRRDETGWSVRLGRSVAALEARLDAQETRHRQELEALRAAIGRPALAAVAEGEPAAALRRLLEESERRQEERLVQALAELSERTEAQRRFDLAQVSAGMSYLEGKASLHAARTTELVGQVLMASQDPEQEQEK
jgi:hypothetical protein